MRPESVPRWCSALPGKISYVPGNHDSRKVREALAEIGWKKLEPFTIAWRDKEGRECLVRVSHRPIMALRPGEANLHGHVHNGPRRGGLLDSFTAAHMNVSVEEIDYRPVQMRDVLAQLEAGINHRKAQGQDDGRSGQLRGVCGRNVLDLGDRVTFLG
jgi:calcineurin-like phosphoesterase family protein